MKHSKFYTINSPLFTGPHHGILYTVSIWGNNPRGAFPCVEEARLTAAQSRSHLHRFLLLRHYVLILDCNWIKIQGRPPGTRQCAFLHFIKHTSHPLRRESRLWRDLEITLRHEEQEGTVRGSNKCYI
jgi:hypothetical protein